MMLKNRVSWLKTLIIVTLVAAAFMWLIIPVPAFAQTGLESQIRETIEDLVRILNILIVGFIAWSGFLIAKGEGSGQTRLIYGIVGLVVVNASYLIIDYFA